MASTRGQDLFESDRLEFEAFAQAADVADRVEAPRDTAPDDVPAPSEEGQLNPAPTASSSPSVAALPSEEPATGAGSGARRTESVPGSEQPSEERPSGQPPSEEPPSEKPPSERPVSTPPRMMAVNDGPREGAPARVELPTGGGAVAPTGSRAGAAPERAPDAPIVLGGVVPKLISIELTPKEVNEGGSVMIRAQVSAGEGDEPTIRGRLSSPSQRERVNFSLRAAAEPGVFEATLTLPEYCEGGEWRVSLLLLDGAIGRTTLRSRDSGLQPARVLVR